MTPLETTTSGALPPAAPATPKRDMSSARLTDLVMHPMAAAAAAAGQTMAQQERESFSQLAAEASAAPTPHTGGMTANGTPGCITPVGSVGGAHGGLAMAGLALSGLSLGPNALITRHSSVDLTGGWVRGSTAGMLRDMRVLLHRQGAVMQVTLLLKQHTRNPIMFS
jgi:hypothetical protein